MTERYLRGVRAVLFDLDGTLVDSAPDLGAAVDRMRVSRGLEPFPIEHYRSMAGAGARGMLGIAFGITPEHPDFAAMREEFFLNYEARLTRSTVAFDGVPELIEQLNAREIRWGVVTNKATRFSRPLIAAMPLFATAAAVVSGDTTPYAKPHPAPLIEAATRIGVPPQQCVYVGDDERDIVAGLAAGMTTVSALYGYLGESSDAARWEAHFTINSPLDLLQLFKSA